MSTGTVRIERPQRLMDRRSAETAAAGAWTVWSWMFSGVLHTAALMVLLFAAPPKGVQIGTDPDAGLTVGLLVRQGPPKMADDETTNDIETDSERVNVEKSASAVQEPATSPRLPDQPPVPLVLPQAQSTPKLGPGAAKPRVSTAGKAADLVASGKKARAATGTPGSKQIGFLGSQAVGVRFAFVLDGSGSMQHQGKIRVAREELLRSVNELEASQQFQIIFYRTEPIPMNSGAKRGAVPANDVNRRLAEAFVKQIVPDGGTNHLEAILEGLRVFPDVLFFLTDGTDPALAARDLEEIRQRNGGSCQIHVIQFGDGLLQDSNSWLHKLARQNNGTFRYHNIQEWRK